MSAKILVADDVLAMRQLLRAILEGAGYGVVEASDGRGLLTAVENDPHLALVLLDISLPDGSGLNFIKKVHRLRPKLKVCFVSGRRQKEDVLQGIQNGALDYVVKPVVPSVLLRKVAAVLQESAASELGQSIARLAVDFSAAALNMPIDLEIRAREISEAGFVGQSSMPLKVGSAVEFSFPGLAKQLNEAKITVGCRVVSCEKSGADYDVQCEFVGLPEALLSKIRALAIRQRPKS